MSFSGKKIVLLVFYLCFNAGMSYSMHFCEGVLQHFNFFAANETCCPEKGELPDCCEDISHLDIPNGEEFQPVVFTLSHAESNYFPSHYFYNTQPKFEVAPAYQLWYAAHAPPLPKSPLFILHQVFLI